MYCSVLLRCFVFGHALLSSVKIASARGGTGGGDARISSSTAASDPVLGRHSEDDTHEEIHPGTQFRHLSPSGGGYVADWNREWFQTGGVGFGSRLSQGKCVNIPDNMTLCRGIGYNQMRLPNLLDHDSVKEAAQQAASWVPLFNVRCHPDTQVFLCSLFAPVCLDRPIWPCKTLCEAVKAGCESRMMKYGFPWPDMLRCDQFPLDDELCIGMRQENQPDETACSACVQADTFESIVDNSCSADFAMKIQLEQAVVAGSDIKLIAGKKRKVYKRGTLSSKELKNLTFNIENGSHCKCKVAEDLMSDQRNAGYYLIMGNRNTQGRLVLSFIERVDRKSTDMTKAMDAIRREKICKTGIQMITSDESKKQNTKQPERKTEGRKDREMKEGREESGRNVTGKKEDKRKEPGVKEEGRKEARRKEDGRKETGKNNGRKEDGRKGGDGKKGVGKNDRKKTENGKRSTDDTRSNPEKNDSRRKQAKSNSKRSPD